MLDYPGIVRTETAALLDAAVRVELTTQVPSCPDWRVADLLRHVGRVHRWATWAATGWGARPSRSAIHEPAQDGDELYAYLQAGGTGLAAVLESLAPETPCWTFQPVEQTVGFWRRRQAMETSIHRYDAQLAAGRPRGFEPDVAADGISEMLNVFGPRAAADVDAPEGIRLRCTDTDRTWLVVSGKGEYQVLWGADAQAGDAGTSVRGHAEDLFLQLWGRPTLHEPTVKGDRGPYDDLLAALVR